MLTNGGKNMFYVMESWIESVWLTIVEFIESTIGYFDNALNSFFNIDLFIFDMYNQHVAGLPVIVKWLGAAFVVLLLVLGTISLIKKSIKLVIIVAVAILLFFIFSR